jgi:hypothetical protein
MKQCRLRDVHKVFNNACPSYLINHFLALSWREQVDFPWDDDEVRFVINTRSWIFRMLDHWNNSPRVDMSSHYASHIILIPRQPVFTLSP